jgi:predicted subunit of tRNA(5-methylaminomethyl-2-thiouridylate) methyltransferase
MMLPPDVFQIVESSPVAVTGNSIVMFSGGRDSTLATIRLAQEKLNLTLVTVSSDHLVGIDQVKVRLAELSRLLPATTEWIRIKQPTELRADTSFYSQTCLPCHHAYVVVGAAIAKKLAADSLAFGYVGYQNTWPEQTPTAVASLRSITERHGIKLLLPVYDIANRNQVIQELVGAGVQSNALEQKCSLQVKNIALNAEQLIAQVALWEKAITKSIAMIDEIEISIIERAPLSMFAKS